MYCVLRAFYSELLYPVALFAENVFHVGRLPQESARFSEFDAPQPCF